MENRVKIKRVKRNKKKITSKEKILAGIGLGGTLLGGMSAVTPKPAPSQIVAKQSDEQTKTSSKVRDVLQNIFGISQAQAATGVGSGLPFPNPARPVQSFTYVASPGIVTPTDSNWDASNPAIYGPYDSDYATQRNKFDANNSAYNYMVSYNQWLKDTDSWQKNGGLLGNKPAQPTMPSGFAFTVNNNGTTTATATAAPAPGSQYQNTPVVDSISASAKPGDRINQNVVVHYSPQVAGSNATATILSYQIEDKSVDNLSTGLPDGLTLDSKTGAISGTINGPAGQYTSTVLVTIQLNNNNPASSSIQNYRAIAQIRYVVNPRQDVSSIPTVNSLSSSSVSRDQLRQGYDAVLSGRSFNTVPAANGSNALGSWGSAVGELVNKNTGEIYSFGLSAPRDSNGVADPRQTDTQLIAHIPDVPAGDYSLRLRSTVNNTVTASLPFTVTGQDASQLVPLLLRDALSGQTYSQIVNDAKSGLDDGLKIQPVLTGLSVTSISTDQLKQHTSIGSDARLHATMVNQLRIPTIGANSGGVIIHAGDVVNNHQGGTVTAPDYVVGAPISITGVNLRGGYNSVQAKLYDKQGNVVPGAVIDIVPFTGIAGWQEGNSMLLGRDASTNGIYTSTQDDILISGNIAPGQYYLRMITSTGISSSYNSLPITVTQGTGAINDNNGGNNNQGGGQESNSGTTGATITTASLPSGAIGANYSHNLTAANFSGPVVWLVTSGNLPDGLTLDAYSGVVAGTPTAAGTYQFTLEATDGPETVTKSMAITITDRAAGQNSFVINYNDVQAQSMPQASSSTQAVVDRNASVGYPVNNYAQTATASTQSDTNTQATESSEILTEQENENTNDQIQQDQSSTLESANDQTSSEGLQMPAGYGVVNSSPDQQAASENNVAAGTSNLQMPNSPAASAATAAASVDAQSSYVVKNGDTLWDIAKKQYGDGRKWRQILSANPNCLSIPGDTRTLKVGTTLVIPR